MKGSGKGWLIAAGVSSTAITLMHILIVLIGERAYRVFGEFGGELADLQKAGSPIPAVLTLFVTACFALFGLYAFSGAGLIRRLPLLRLGLLVIGLIYLLRGLMNIPYYGYVLAGGGKITAYDAILYDSVSLVIGILYLVGTKLVWGRLKPERGKILR